MQKRALFGLVFVLCGAIPATAAAQSDADRQRARELGQAGLVLFDKGDFAGALAKLNEADAIVKVPTVGLFAARALNRLDRVLEARARLQQVVAIPLPPNSPDVWKQAKIDAAAELTALDKECPRMQIELVGVAAAEIERVTVSVDGRTAPIEQNAVRVDPGKRELVVRLASRARTFSVEAHRGQTQKVRADLTGPTAVEAADGPNALTIVGIVSLGLGGGGLVVWGATGGAALAKASDYQCDGAQCNADDVSDLQTLRTTSLVSFYVGGGLALVGTGLLIGGLVTAGEKPATAAIRPLVGPGFVGVSGSF